MDYSDYKKTPNCLRKYRKARGLKQKDVAGILGLNSTSMVSRWEQGACLPNSLNVFKLAVLYRIMTDALFVDLRELVKDDILVKEKEVLKINQNKNLCKTLSSFHSETVLREPCWNSKEKKSLEGSSNNDSYKKEQNL